MKKVTTFDVYTVDYETGKGVMTSLGVNESAALIVLAGIGLTVVAGAVVGCVTYGIRTIVDANRKTKR